MSDWFEYMTIGNDTCNRYWEGNIGLNRYYDFNSRKPNSSATLDQIKKFVYEKYVKKKFALPGEKDPITLLREKPEPVEVKQPSTSVKNKVQEVEDASQESNPDEDLLDFDVDEAPASKPSGESITSAKGPKVLEIDLMDFSEPTIKKSHSLEPIHHTIIPQVTNLYQQPPIVPHNQQHHHLPNYSHQYYQVPQQPVIHNNLHFGPFQQQHQHPQQPIYSHLSGGYQHNGNIGYVAHGNYQPPIHQPPQQQPFSMNINMYANNISFNIHS
jgi:hypothetical protein